MFSKQKIPLLETRKYTVFPSSRQILIGQISYINYLKDLKGQTSKENCVFVVLFPIFSPTFSLLPYMRNGLYHWIEALRILLTITFTPGLGLLYCPQSDFPDILALKREGENEAKYCNITLEREPCGFSPWPQVLWELNVIFKWHSLRESFLLQERSARSGFFASRKLWTWRFLGVLSYFYMRNIWKHPGTFYDLTKIRVWKPIKQSVITLPWNVT